MTPPTRIPRSFPVTSAVLVAAVGLGSLELGTRLAGRPAPNTPGAVLAYALPFVVVLACLWFVGSLRGIRPTTRGLHLCLTRGWPVLPCAGVVGLLSVLSPGPEGVTVPVSVGWFLAATACTAVFEEFLCRGAVQTLLVDGGLGPARAVLLASAVFSVLHLANLVATPDAVVGTVAQVGYTFCLGVLLGAVYLASGNLWVPVLLHLAYNVLGDLGTLRHGTPVDPAGDVSVATGVLLVVLALPMLVAGLVLARGLGRGDRGRADLRR